MCLTILVNLLKHQYDCLLPLLCTQSCWFWWDTGFMEKLQLDLYHYLTVPFYNPAGCTFLPKCLYCHKFQDIELCVQRQVKRFAHLLAYLLCVSPTEVHTYYQCWTFADCNFNYLSQHFGERKLWYNCCQKDLCNRSAGTSITGTTVLLVTQLLTAFWKFFI